MDENETQSKTCRTDFDESRQKQRSVVGAI